MWQTLATLGNRTLEVLVEDGRPVRVCDSAPILEGTCWHWTEVVELLKAAFPQAPFCETSLGEWYAPSENPKREEQCCEVQLSS